jgi:hypothetical protein
LPDGQIARPARGATRLDRDCHQIRGHNAGARDRLGLGRSVDNGKVETRGKLQGIAGHIFTRHADHLKRRLGAQAGPSGGGPLLIGVDQQDVLLEQREAGGNIDRKRRLSDAALLIQKRNNQRHQATFDDSRKPSLVVSYFCVKVNIQFTLFPGNNICAFAATLKITEPHLWF